MRAAAWIKRTALGFGLVIALLVAGLVWLLGTETGRLWLVRQGQALAVKSQVAVSLKDLRSPRLGEWRAQRIDLAMGGEPFLKLQEPVLVWRPAALFRGALQIDQLTAARVDYFHRKSPAPKEQPEQASTGIPKSPVVVTVKHFGVDILALHDFGRSLPDYSVKGAGEAFGAQVPLQLQLDLRSLASPETKVQITTQASSSTAAAIQGTIKEAPGGLLGSLVRWPTAESINASFRLALEQEENRLRLAIEEVQVPLAGHQLSAAGTLEYIPESQTLTVNEIVLMTDGNRQLLRGGYSPVDLWAQLNFTRLPLDLATPWYADLQGGTADGTLEISWLHRESGRWPSVTADLQVAAEYKDQSFALDLKGAMEQKILSLDPSRVQSGGAVLESQGVLDLQGDQSDLQGSVANFHTDLLKPWPVPVPPELTASSERAKFHLRGSLRDPDLALTAILEGIYKDRNFHLNLDGRFGRRNAAIRHAELTSEGSELRASGVIDWSGNTSRLDLTFANFTHALLHLAPPAVAAKFPQNLAFRADGTARVAGSLRRPLISSQSQISGTYTLPGEVLPYRIDLNGSVAAGKLADLKLNAEQVEMYLFDKPILNLKGKYTAKTIDLNLRLTQLPTQLLAAFGWQRIDGEAEADLRVSGSLKRPQINGYMTYRDRLWGKSRKPEQVELRTEVATEQDQLNLAATVTHEQTPAGTLSFRLPLGLYLQRQGDQVPLNLDIEGEWDLRFLRLFLDLGSHRLDGHMVAALEVAGDTNNPIFQGNLRLERGTYNNLVTGTQLEDIQVLLEGQGENLVVREARAQSGDGEVSLSGNIVWQKEKRLQPNAVDLTLRAKDAALVQRRDLQAEVRGQVAVTGSFNELWIKGELEVFPLTANIDSAVKTRIPEIKVTEVVDDAPVEMANESTLPVVNLDITLIAAQQAYLRGRGLDTELEGRISLSGTASKPEYRGQFATRRGRIDLFGKRFVLDDGEVLFNNGGVILRIPAVHKRSDIEIRAELHGTAEEPKLTLSSTPPLPDDEILARLIFDKPVEEMTPFEAIRLAGAVRTLTSGGGGFDPVDSAREMLGVDSLTIGSETTDQGSAYSVGVGKYLNERVYVELGRSSNPAQPWRGSVEVELTPKITLESSTNETGGGGAELLWKKDY